MVNLGDKVKDPITGIEGIAVCRHSYLQGCDRITVQRKVDKEGKIPDECSFDEPQLEVVKSSAIKRKAPKKNPGGPAKHLPTSRTTGSKR